MSALKSKHSAYNLDIRTKALQKKLNRIRRQQCITEHQILGPDDDAEPSENFEELFSTTFNLFHHLKHRMPCSPILNVQTVLTDTREAIRKLNQKYREKVAIKFLAIQGPVLVKNLIEEFKGSIEIMKEITWILICVFAGATPDECHKIVADAGLIPTYKFLLTIPDYELISNVIWGVANFVYNCPKLQMSIQECELVKDIHKTVKEVLQASRRDDPATQRFVLEIYENYLMFIDFYQTKNIQLVFKNLTPLLEEIMREIFDRFGDCLSEKILHPFFRIFYNFLEYGRSDPAEKTAYLSDHPRMLFLLKKVCEIMEDDTLSRKKDGFWDLTCNLMSVFLEKFDTGFTQHIIRNGIFEVFVKMTQKSKIDVTWGSVFILEIAQKELNWNDPELVATILSNGEFFGYLLGVLDKFRKSEEISSNIVHILGAFWNNEQMALVQLCMERPGELEPFFGLFEEGNQAVLLPAVELILKICSGEPEDFGPMGPYNNFKEHLMTYEHVAMDYIIHNAGNTSDHGFNCQKIIDILDGSTRYE